MELLFLPFIFLLLSIALTPLAAPQFWHKYHGWVAAAWAAIFLVLFYQQNEATEVRRHLLQTLMGDYLPFILLLAALYIIAGGVRITGRLVGTPGVNTAILAVGTLLASWIGTTGAAMLFIRPLLRANQKRRFQVHTLIFFIILVANCGGSLTPLGDPPLFLGFLHGIDFFWTTKNMLAPAAFICGVLLAQYWILDTLLWRREEHSHTLDEKHPEETAISIEGSINLLFLAGVLMAVMLSSVESPGLFSDHGTTYAELGRDLLLLFMAWLSWRWTPKHIRADNHFTWFPIKEVGVIFAAIFITIIPVLDALGSGRLPVTDLLAGPAHYFWLTGLLSSVLDNAPTYLVFFYAAGGDPASLMGPQAQTLLAISSGAVFMGALTYIGNAPNFMVRSIAQERGLKMPNFFAYVFWASLILMPLFAVATLIWFLP